jgi:hypothetical protein
MKRQVEKDPRVLLPLALRWAFAKVILSPADYQRFKARELELRHEANPNRIVVDKDDRLILLALMPSAWKYIDILPRNGWAALREISKIIGGSDDNLRIHCERGFIKPDMIREDFDNVRTAQKILDGGAEVRPRHRGRRT